MATSNSSTVKIILTMAIATIHTDNEPSIHVEHFFDIQELENVGLKLNENFFFYGARDFFDETHIIYQKLIRMFWKNVEFANNKVSKVLGTKVVLGSIAKAPWCLREGSIYQEE